jgi:hypothetical protein
LALFVEAVGGPSKAQERIVLVRIEDVKQNRLPEVLQDCRMYDFFKVHPTRKVTLTYGQPEFPELESDYLISMLELVGDEHRAGLVTRLVKLLGPPTLPGTDPLVRAIVLWRAFCPSTDGSSIVRGM